ncbi:threonine ammonia-lyase [Cognatishimia activa]|uniref:Threonine/serine dehydratase n=1 Tax=Cognatishimia activa TaxID=1715691 RepID=A0A975I6E1_9RHOB|nr:threonine/serine dehydratase [Cognatishimia activa]QTN34993.1 threonine/serine dehydratase [Cognatishimia activa]
MNIDMIEAAAQRLKGHARRTPLLSSPFLDEIAGRHVFVKPENLQHTGSFKFRGGWSAVSALSDAQRKQGVIAFSSGNHAQGVASAAAAHGVKAVIVMPADAPQIKIDNTRALGADVVLYDRAGGESREEAAEAYTKAGMILIRPYDDAQVIAGQGTTGLEIAEQAAEVGINAAEVLICTGGGGLSAGISLALEAKAPKMKVRTCEPQGFDDVRISLETGAITAHNSPAKGLCDAILTPAPGEMTFPILHRLAGQGIAVSDEEAKRAMALAFNRLKIVLEPGGAVSLAAALFHGDALAMDTAIAVTTGGNVDPALFTQVLQTYG